MSESEDVDRLIDSLEELNERSELWDALAESYKCSFSALMGAGFTREEAVLIISRRGAGLT